MGQLTLFLEIFEHITSSPDGVALHLVIVGRSLDDGLMEGDEESGGEGGGKGVREVGQSPGSLHSDGEVGGA